MVGRKKTETGSEGKGNRLSGSFKQVKQLGNTESMRSTRKRQGKSELKTLFPRFRACDVFPRADR